MAAFSLLVQRNGSDVQLSSGEIRKGLFATSSAFCRRSCTVVEERRFAGRDQCGSASWRFPMATSAFTVDASAAGSTGLAKY